MKNRKTTLSEIAGIISGTDKKTSTTKWGVVKSVNTDSQTGEVISYNVQLDGANQQVECRKLTGAKAGDVVQVTLNTNGSAAVSGTVGGDTDAKDAVNNYFWHDTDGAHVSLLEKVVTGVKNVLINSTGMFIRNGTTELASFTADTVELGKNNNEASIKLCSDVGRIGTFTSSQEKGFKVHTATGYSGADYWSNGDDNETVMYAGPAVSVRLPKPPFARVRVYAPESGDSEIDISADVVKINDVDMSDAPSDGSEYVRKNGAWAVASGGGSAECPFPVGSVLLFNDSTDPNNTWEETTWSQVASDRYLIGAGSSHTAGSTGGSDSFTLTANNLPSHCHSLNSHSHTMNHGHSFTNPTIATAGAHVHSLKYDANNSGTAGKQDLYGTARSKTSSSGCISAGDHTHSYSANGSVGNYSGSTGASSGNTGYSGSGTAVSVQPSYYTVCVWARTA